MPTRSDPETAHIGEFDSKNFLKQLTERPGVYRMYDEGGSILYVGKARNLKNRVSSYFRKTGLAPKTEALVSKIASIEVTITGSETDPAMESPVFHSSQYETWAPAGTAYADGSIFFAGLREIGRAHV